MAPATKKSLASRAGAAARKVVSRSSSDGKAAKGAAKSAAKKVAKKVPATQAAAKKAVTKKASVKTSATKVPAQKTAPNGAPAAKAAPRAAARKSSPAKKSAVATPAENTPSKKAAKTTVTAQPVAKKTTATKAPARRTGTATPAELLVLEGEDPWTKAELKEVQTQLADDVDRLTGELAEVEGDLAGMIENSGEGAGHDQADVGSASFERDQEMVIVNNARDMLDQSQHALERIADGTFGKCENCGNAIGKNRLMAFPRATMCLRCKQREERR
ncbi:MAG: DNA-binding protein [Marmoricola sp.]|nr:DNA-binding protein [Marmoricola sp.]